MIDIRKAETQAAEWGISLPEWMELQIQVYGNVDAFGDANFDNWNDEGWRSRVAAVLVKYELYSKANRYLECFRYAHLFKCEGERGHTLFSPIYCDLRFCLRCAPRQFARLIEKYEPVLRSISARKKPGFAFRKITLTSRNTGSLSPEQVKKFNLDIKKTLKTLLRGVQGWGALFCDEVGFNNTNLHAHIIFYGPYVPQYRLALDFSKWPSMAPAVSTPSASSTTSLAKTLTTPKVHGLPAPIAELLS
jgi:hypothetical protein